MFTALWTSFRSLMTTPGKNFEVEWSEVSDVYIAHETNFVKVPDPSTEHNFAQDPLFASLADVSTSHSILGSSAHLHPAALQSHHQVLFAERNQSPNSKVSVWTMAVKRALQVCPLTCDTVTHAHVSTGLDTESREL